MPSAGLMTQMSRAIRHVMEDNCAVRPAHISAIQLAHLKAYEPILAAFLEDVRDEIKRREEQGNG